MKEKKGILAPRYNVYTKANFIQDPDTWEALCHTLATQQYHFTMLVTDRLQRRVTRHGFNFSRF
jgi:hypothetical protein